MDIEEFVKRLAIFCTLMQSKEGILSKSPKYLLTKFEVIMTVPYPENALDWENKRVYERWLETWMEYFKELHIPEVG